MKNISKIISILFLSFSILLMCYVFYRSQIFHKGTLFNYYINYYVIAFLLIFLSFISFFIPKKLKINITTVFLSILIGMYLVEGYLSINKKNLKPIIYKINTGKNYDRRTNFQIYKDLKKKDPNIVVSIGPGHFIKDSDVNYLPLSGISNRKTILCNEGGYFAIYQSDRYGFNNPDEEWNKDDIEFLLVGDSYTHGACVNEPDTISGNLRKLNNNKNAVLNLGQSGNGPLIEYATLREYLPFKNVKRVLWIYFENNDLNELNDELNNQILVNYLKDKNFTQNLISRKQEIKKLLLKKLDEEIIIKEREYNLEQEKFIGIGLSRFLKLYSVRQIIFQIIFPVPDQAAPLKDFEHILKLSNELVKENNSKLYFVYLSEYFRYKWNNNNDNFQNYKKVTEIVESLNIPIIDLNKELLEKHNDRLSLFPFRMIGHHNEKGYQLIAKTIFGKINELEK
jgi:hypothetical protein